MSIHQSFCYNGQPFQLAYQNTIAFLAGRYLYFWDLETNEKDYIESSKNGFQSFVCNHTKGLIFVAEYGINPNVYVYSYPDKKLITKSNSISKLEIIKMDISLNGKKLLVVTGVPDYEITVFDISKIFSDHNEEGEIITRLKGAQSSLTLKSKFLDAKFSPEKDTSFAVLYENCIQLCEIFPSYEQEDSDQNVQKNIRIQKITQQADDKFSTFIWDEQNNIYLADKFIVKYLNGEDLKEIAKNDCFFPINFFVLTQKHIIIVQDSGQFDWLFKYIQSNIEDEELKPFKLDKKFQYQDEKLVQIMYDHNFKKLFAGTQEGSILILPEEAESFGDEEEEMNDQEGEGSDDDDKTKEIEIKYTQYGPYPVGSVIFLREFQKLNILLTISSQGRIFLWNLQNQKQELLYTSQIKSQVSSAEMDSKDQLLFLGSNQGVLRVLNFQNLRDIEVIKHLKLLKNKPIDFLQLNREKDILVVGSKNSKKVYFLSCSEKELENSKPFRIIGYYKLPFRFNNLQWNTCLPSKQVLSPNGRSNLHILANYFLLTIESPDPNQDYKDFNLQLKLHGKKIDPNLHLITINHNNGDIYTSGSDKLIKRYSQPHEEYSEIDPKMKAGPSPEEEYDGHSLQANFMKILPLNNKLISGGQDGSIFIRELSDLNSVQEIKGHNLKFNGVSTLEYSKKYPLLYSGGYDGSIFLWSLTASVDIQQIDNNEDDVLEERSEIQDVEDGKITHYKKVLEEEYIKSQKEIREKQKKEISDGLQEITENLIALLQQNDNADDLEKLTRDDFVIDIETRDTILQQGKDECQKLRINAQKQNYKQEILREKLMEKTWNTMQEHLKSINGLDSNIIVYNYHIRKRTQQEQQKLKWVQNFRKLEIKEKNMRKEQNIQEVIDIKEFITNPNEYFVNGTPQKPQLVLEDYEKQEEAKQQEALLNQKPTKVVQGQGAHAHGPKGANTTQGKSGGFQNAKAKKEAELKKQQEEKEAEERKKKQEEEAKKATNEPNQEGGESQDISEWNYLYGALELFTNNQKRNQIIMLQSIIFKIKQEFNKEFEDVQKVRASMIDNIQDKNKKIEEILLELHKEAEFFEPKININENPEKNILHVDGKTEIPFEKFLTREERKRLEEERKKEEDRLAALMADDLGRRAIQKFMNGTLEEKKENLLDDVLEREDWMDLPQEEMTDEQRTKFKEYEILKQKQDEEKEKIRKNLEAQLKKLRQEIVEFCQKFDQKLLILFRRKLEYDYRISEQELYIVKLSLSIILEKDYSQQKFELENLKVELQEKIDISAQLLAKLDTKLEDAKNSVQAYDLQFRNPQQNIGHKDMIDDSKIKQIWKGVFEHQKDEKEKKQYDEQLMSNPEYKNQLIQLDPYREVRKKEIKKELESNYESYIDDIRNKASKLPDMDQENVQENLLRVLRNKFQSQLEKEKYETESKDIQASLHQQQTEYQQIQQKFQEYEANETFVIENLQNAKSDIEVILRFKQGLVEISSGQMSPQLSSAILIHKELIEKKNEEIQSQGNDKIRLMEAIKNIKEKVADSNYELKKLQKTIERVECQTKEVQLLKVKKEMQLALTKKDMKLNEYELQGLQNQINMLIDATNKRISALQKKEEKIDEQNEFIMRENEQLKIQGGQLDNTVKQRQKINEMMQKKNQVNIAPTGDDKRDEEAFNKFKQIALIRKLYDLAKRQTESIELLREELNKLKARTFANFSSVNR